MAVNPLLPAQRLYTEYRTLLSAVNRNARLFLLGDLFLGIGSNIIGLLYNLYLKELAIPPGDIGSLMSVRALGSVLVALPASFILARSDIRRFLVIGTFLSAAAFAAQSLTESYPAIVVMVFLGGAFGAVFQVCAGPFLMENSTEKTRLGLFSLNAAISMGTGMLGSLIGGLLRDGLVAAGMDGVLSYRVALLAGVAFILASLVPFAGIRGAGHQHGPTPQPPIPDSDSYTYPGEVTAPDEDGRLRGEIINPETTPSGAAAVRIPWVKLLLPGFLIGTGAGLTIPWINLYFKDVFALSDGAIGLLFALGQVGTFIGIAAGPSLARRLGSSGAIVWCQALSIPFIVVLAWLHWLPLVILAYLARQSLMNMSTPILDSFSLEQVPAEKRHLLNALRMLNWTGAWMFAAWLAGLLIGRWGYSPSFTATAICYTVGTVLFALFWKVRRPGRS